MSEKEEEKEEKKEEDIPCPYDIILDFYDRNVSFGKLNPGLFGNLNPGLFGNILLIKYILRNQKKNTQTIPIPLIETQNIIDNYLSTESSQNPEEEWEIINQSNSE